MFVFRETKDDNYEVGYFQPPLPGSRAPFAYVFVVVATVSTLFDAVKAVNFLNGGNGEVPRCLGGI